MCFLRTLCMLRHTLNIDQNLEPCHKTHSITISNSIQLKTIAGWPPGTTFLGAQLSKATVSLNSPNGLISQIIINSGSNISLILSKLLERFNPPLRLKEGQNIKIDQVTGWSSTNQYIPLDLYFKTSPDLVVLHLEAYIIKDMNAPLILGNNFTNQYSLLIIWDNSLTSLKLGDLGYSIPLDSSVDSSFLSMDAFQVKIMAVLHRKRNKEKQRLHKPNWLMIMESITLSLLGICKIPFKTTAPIQDSIFVPIKFQGQKFRDVILINSKINLETKIIHIINQSTQKNCIQE